MPQANIGTDAPDVCSSDCMERLTTCSIRTQSQSGGLSEPVAFSGYDARAIHQSRWMSEVEENGDSFKSLRKRKRRKKRTNKSGKAADEAGSNQQCPRLEIY